MTLKKITKFTIIFFFIIYLTQNACADLSIEETDITFSTENPYIGQEVKVYVKVYNSSNSEARGVVKIFNETEGIFIGGDQPIAVLANSYDNAFASFKPQISGYHKITARVIPFDESNDNPENNKTFITIFVNKEAEYDNVAEEIDENEKSETNESTSSAKKIEENYKPKKEFDNILLWSFSIVLLIILAATSKSTPR